MYKKAIKNIGSKALRYMTLGWTRFKPNLQLIESHSHDVGKYGCTPADIYLEFGDQLDYIIQVRCESKDFNQTEIYRFKADSITRADVKTSSQNSIQIGERIKTVHIYETYQYDGIKEFNDEEYFPNGLLFEFVSGKYLGILGQEGDDQCEPCHYIKFIPSDEIEIYRIEWMQKWKEYEQIEIE